MYSITCNSANLYFSSDFTKSIILKNIDNCATNIFLSFNIFNFRGWWFLVKHVIFNECNKPLDMVSQLYLFIQKHVFRLRCCQFIWCCYYVISETCVLWIINLWNNIKSYNLFLNIIQIQYLLWVIWSINCTRFFIVKVSYWEMNLP